MIEIKTKGRVTRAFTETRGAYTNTYLAVDCADSRAKYPNVLKFRLRTDEDTAVGEGDEVEITAYLDGREWHSQDGRTLYFMDLNVKSCKLIGEAEPHAAPGARAVTTATKQDAIDAWTTVHPDDPGHEVAMGIAAACEAACPATFAKAKDAGKRFSELAKPSDWAQVVNHINGITVAEAAKQVTDDADDLPF